MEDDLDTIWPGAGESADGALGPLQPLRGVARA